MITKYLEALDELNLLVSASYILSQGNADEITEDVLSILINAYKLGNEAACRALEQKTAIKTDEMEAAIYFMIDGKTFEDRIIKHLKNEDISGLQTLVTSEFHRVYNAAAQNAAESIRREGGKNITKTWLTVMDNRVRDTHSYLEGMTIPLDNLFFTYDGDFALYPGGFQTAVNNANCRCTLIYKTQAE